MPQRDLYQCTGAALVKQSRQAANPAHKDTRWAARALEVDDTDKTDGPRTRTARKLARRLPCGATGKAGVEVGQV